MEKKVKVLHIINGPSGTVGGVERFLMAQYAHMERSVIRFDFAFTRMDTMQMVKDEPILEGCRFFPTHALDHRLRTRKFFSLYRSLCRIIRDNGYDIVHMDSGSPVLQTIAAAAARHCGTPCFIAHSHNGSVIHRELPKQPRPPLPIRCLQHYVAAQAAHLFACSEAAGISMLGAEVASPKYRVLKNGIDYRKFAFDPAVREDVRRQYHAENRTVYAAIGRFSLQKNPLFMLDIFAGIARRDGNAVLWLFGDGEMRPQIEEKLRKLKLADRVTLWGQRDDIPRMEQAIDCLLFPSLYEGLSVVSIEAQAAGLPIFASDSISEEHKVTELVTFLPLSLGADAWAERICLAMRRLPARSDHSSEVLAAGYDSAQTAAVLSELYMKYAH